LVPAFHRLLVRTSCYFEGTLGGGSLTLGGSTVAEGTFTLGDSIVVGDNFTLGGATEVGGNFTLGPSTVTGGTFTLGASVVGGGLIGESSANTGTANIPIAISTTIIQMGKTIFFRMLVTFFAVYKSITMFRHYQDPIEQTADCLPLLKGRIFKQAPPIPRPAVVVTFSVSRIL